MGAGDLGTSAERVDASLGGILKVSATWGAVVLIDEADVFLEERSLQFLERNAMVAVFLRHLEYVLLCLDVQTVLKFQLFDRYFRGILFLTTNRVRVFDEAFQSRIHVSLRYADLSSDAKRSIWLAFLRRVNGNVPNGGISHDELHALGEKKVNGRQIKNACRTATALAVSRGERMRYSHLEQALNAMEEFMTDFAAISGGGH